MHEKLPPIPSVEKLTDVEQVEHPPILIEEWAQQNSHATLLRHIESSDKTDKNIGILRENIYYDPAEKTMTLTVPIRDIHRGHTFEQTQKEIMLGGVPAIFMDVTSGALAFTEMPSDCVPLHLKVEVTRGVMIVQREDIPLVIVSSFEQESSQGGKKLFIKTIVTQGPNVCATELSEVKVFSEQSAGIMAQKVNTSLDRWLESQKQERAILPSEEVAGQATTGEVREAAESKEDREERLVQELLQLVSSNPDFIFGISANGKLGSPYYSDGTSTLGQTGYLFDGNKQHFFNTNENGQHPNPLVYEDQLRGNPIFEPIFQCSQQNIGQDEFIQFKTWMTLKYTPDNRLTSDHRPGLYFGGGLFIRNGKTSVEAVSEDLLKIIQSGRSGESREILWKFLVAAFEKYTPDWWQYAVTQWEAQPQNKGKKIKDFFQ